MSKHVICHSLWLIILFVGIKPAYCVANISTDNEYSQLKHWDIKKAIFTIEPDFLNETIKGEVIFSVELTNKTNHLLFSIFKTMVFDSVFINHKETYFNKKEDSVYSIPIHKYDSLSQIEVHIFFHGKPLKSLQPPWQGGINWGKDSLERNWITTSCQGEGSYVWLPSKMDLSDKYDTLRVNLIVPKNLIGVSNGRLIDIKNIGDKHIFSWKVTKPIISYNVSMNIGHYKSFDTTINIVNNQQDISLWFLDYDLDKAVKQLLPEVEKTLLAFSDMLVPYPFIDDSYKLVEVNYLGMEHQSAVAYGNEFKQGYKGNDLSKTGIGLLKDFIIIHETGHEWFGNSLSMKNPQDMWINEAFTSYLESLYLEYYYGRDTAEKYLVGKEILIANKQPMCPDDINSDGGSDMYFKGERIIMGFRYLIQNDSLFFSFLRNLLTQYQYQSISTADFLTFVDSFYNKHYSWYFLEYIQNQDLPVLEYHFNLLDSTLVYNWESNTAEDFSLPIQLQFNDKKYTIYPSNQKQILQLSSSKPFVETKHFNYFPFLLNIKKMESL